MKKNTLAWAACLAFSLVTGLPVAHAQSAYPPPPPVYDQAQLDQMLAPVALYPDSLLAQVLMASTYPLEVVQAQRFVEARPGLQGDGLARSVAPMPWDPSVKSLVQFPAVLAMMNDRLDWTQQLGQAFLSQQANVMDTVQALRERAQVTGSLQSGPQQRVLDEDGLIVIEPVSPQTVYVPYYNPQVVYGSWWWPAAQPVYWNPPPRYRPPQYRPGVTASISFGSGVGILRGSFGEARPDWRGRQVMVTQTRITNTTNNTNVTVNRNVTINQRPTVWHHDPRYGGGGRNPVPPQGQQHQPQPQQQAQQQRPPQQAQPHQPPPAAAVAPAAPAGPAAAPQRAFMPPQQQQVIQQDQARERQARQQQDQREREAQQQQRQREQVANEQQRQREEQARGQRQQAQQQAQQQQHQREQQAHEQARQQQQQAQQVRQQQEQVRREAPQPRPAQPAAQPQQAAQPASDGGHDRRQRERRDNRDQ